MSSENKDMELLLKCTLGASVYVLIFILAPLEVVKITLAFAAVIIITILTYITIKELKE